MSHPLARSIDRSLAIRTPAPGPQSTRYTTAAAAGLSWSRPAPSQSTQISVCVRRGDIRNCPWDPCLRGAVHCPAGFCSLAPRSLLSSTSEDGRNVANGGETRALVLRLMPGGHTAPAKCVNRRLELVPKRRPAPRPDLRAPPDRSCSTSPARSRARTPCPVGTDLAPHFFGPLKGPIPKHRRKYIAPNL